MCIRDRWESNYGYLPITPRAGDLWIFPGYVPHAVLPRALPRDGNGASDAGTPVHDQVADEEDATAGMRISVACNIFPKDGSFKGGHESESESLRAIRCLLGGVDVRDTRES